MKKRIILLMLMLFSLLVVACGKSDDEKKSEGGILESLTKEENVVSENLDKYNSYIDLYNELVDDSTPIASFLYEYEEAFMDDNGNFVKPNVNNHNLFAVSSMGRFTFFERILDGVKNNIDSSPKYDFDKDVERLVELSFSLKDVMTRITDYYRNGFYKDDNYEKGQKLHDEYVLLVDEFLEKSDKFFTEMEKLEDENNKVLLKELERNDEIAQLKTLQFKMAVDRFSNVLYDREETVFSDEDTKKLKELSAEIANLLSEVEAITDKQLDKEGISKESFKDSYLKRSRELNDYIVSLVGRIEKKQSVNEINERIEDFENAYSNLIDAYNSMI